MKRGYEELSAEMRALENESYDDLVDERARQLKEAQEQASYWKSHAQDVERQLKTLILERKDLISKLERLLKRLS